MKAIVQRGTSNTFEKIQHYLNLVKIYKKKTDLQTGPDSIQNYKEIASFLQSCQFYLKSVPLSEANFVMLEQKCIAMHGIVLLVKKMRSWFKQKFNDFFEANYIDYIHYNVVQPIDLRIDQVILDITKINIHNVESGQMIRNTHNNRKSKKICSFRDRLVQYVHMPLTQRFEFIYPRVRTTYLLEVSQAKDKEKPKGTQHIQRIEKHRNELGNRAKAPCSKQARGSSKC
jgi:hypothetical protein